MTMHRKQILLLLALLLGLGGAAFAAEPPAPVFPIRASDDGSHFVDAAGRPFASVTDWTLEIMAKLSKEDALHYIETRHQQGFTGIQCFVTPPFPEQRNAEGHFGFDPATDLTRPVDGWWDHADWFAAECEKRGMIVSFHSLFFGCCAQFSHYWSPWINAGNARTYGRFLGRRFAARKNVVWVHGGDREAAEWLPLVREMAAGIEEEAPHHLQGYNAAGYNFMTSGSTHRSLHTEQWVDFNTTAHWDGVFYPEITLARSMQPSKPVLAVWLSLENQVPGYTPVKMRQQAWLPFIAGGTGTTWGHGQMWWFNNVPWKDMLQSPGAVQTGLAARLIAAMPWADWVTDDTETLVRDGIGMYGTFDYANAAITRDRSFAIVYVPTARTLTLDLSTLRGPVTAEWIDPVNGSVKPAALDTATAQVTTPGANAAGDADWVLTLRASSR